MRCSTVVVVASWWLSQLRSLVLTAAAHVERSLAEAPRLVGASHELGTACKKGSSFGIARRLAGGCTFGPCSQRRSPWRAPPGGNRSRPCEREPSSRRRCRRRHCPSAGRKRAPRGCTVPGSTTKPRASHTLRYQIRSSPCGITPIQSWVGRATVQRRPPSRPRRSVGQRADHAHRCRGHRLRQTSTGRRKTGQSGSSRLRRTPIGYNPCFRRPLHHSQPALPSRPQRRRGEEQARTTAFAVQTCVRDDGSRWTSPRSLSASAAPNYCKRSK